MISEYERFHGAALREIIVCASGPVSIEALGQSGRLAAFLINRRVGLLMKHSSKRLPPWRFTFTDGAIDELRLLERQAESVWIALVCGMDGLLALDRAELTALTDDGALGVPYVRVDRDRHTQYRVAGNTGALGSAKARGVSALIAAIETRGARPD